MEFENILIERKRGIYLLLDSSEMHKRASYIRVQNFLNDAGMKV